MKDINPKVVNCPECGNEIELTSALFKQLEDDIANKYRELYKSNIKIAEQKARETAQKDAEDKYSIKVQALENQVADDTKKLKNLKQREAVLKEKEDNIDKLRAQLEKDYESKFENAKKNLSEKAKLKAKEEINVEFEDLRSQRDDYKNKYKDSQKLELDLRKLKHQLEADREEFELIKAREIDAARQEEYKKARDDAGNDYKLKIRDKDQKLEQLSKTVEQLNKKLEQGSQQAQGESQELELEDFLGNKFPLDTIEPIGKGQKGADILQVVKNEYGQECGKILWESKRHKRFDKNWVPKLKDDVRDAKANIGVIISQVLPEDIVNVGLLDGVWIGGLTSTYGIALMLRERILQVSQLQQSAIGKNEKMEALYNYLVSHEFAQRMEAIFDALASMKNQISKERRVFENQWSEREQLVNQIIKNASGMHGDLKGLIGASLPELESLKLPESRSEEDRNEKTKVVIEDNDELPFQRKLDI